jgi:hypothetical protein
LTLQDRHLDNSKALRCAGRELKSSEIRTGEFMVPLECFHQSRSVIEDFTSRTLAAIPSDFGRLYYVSSLKNEKTGQYTHEGLLNLYPEHSVQAALAQCHEELFSRILETPLSNQERDMRNCLDAAGDKFWAVVESWRETRFYRTMCPEGLPDYLNELFCSNMNALLAVFSANNVN